jgi:membrane protein DedA with SNARE-associated domain
MTTLDTIAHILQVHGLLVLFPIAVVEGPIITVIAGYLASLGYLNIFAVYLVVVLSDLIGDSLCYLLGRSGQNVMLERWGTRFGVTQQRLAALREYFQFHAGTTLLIGKLTHSAGLIIMLAAGASKMPFGTFIWFNLLGTLPKSLFFLLVGYTLGHAYNQVDSYIFRASLIALVVLGVVASFWLARTRTRHNLA